MANWIDVVAAEEFRDGARRLLHRVGQSVALFDLKGACYAIDDSCPHAAAHSSSDDWTERRCSARRMDCVSTSPRDVNAALRASGSVRFRCG